MEESSIMFVEELRERLADITSYEPPVPDTAGIEVEEHDYDDLDDETQTALNRMFDTMRLSKIA